MIVPIFAAVLITQTYDGKFTITEAPSMHACEEAKCVALEGVPCAGVAKAKAEREAAWRLQEEFNHREQAKRDATYLAAHPKRVEQCRLKKPKRVCDTRAEVDYAVDGISFSTGTGIPVTIMPPAVVGYSTGLHNEGDRLATVMSPAAVSQAWCAQ